MWSKITKENKKAFRRQGSLQMGDIFHHDHQGKKRAYKQTKENKQNFVFIKK